MSLLHSAGSAGISTCCPSPTTNVLGLGPDLPWADEPSPGNLGLSTGMVLTCLSLLIPAFSLLYSPHVLPVMLLPVHNAPLPLAVVNSVFSASRFGFQVIRCARIIRWHPQDFPRSRGKIPGYNSPFLPSQKNRVHNRESDASVTCFSPGHLRRTTTRPVSYYALFQWMAASKPTSWLSVQLHILSHLTRTSGP